MFGRKPPSLAATLRDHRRFQKSQIAIEELLHSMDRRIKIAMLTDPNYLRKKLDWQLFHTLKEDVEETAKSDD